MLLPVPVPDGGVSLRREGGGGDGFREGVSFAVGSEVDDIAAVAGFVVHAPGTWVAASVWRIVAEISWLLLL